MKFEFEGYEVEVEARRKGQKTFDKGATLTVMNFVSMAMMDAFQRSNGNGYTGLACMYLNSGKDIYEQLKGYGLFEFLKEKAEEARRMADKEVVR